MTPNGAAGGVDLPSPVDWADALDSLGGLDRSVPSVTWATPGATAAAVQLEDFCTTRLKIFDDDRNQPSVNALSGLSPWLHFGQIGAQRAVLEVKKQTSHSKGVAGFVEEAVVRRELSDNFCWYNSRYDNIEGAAGWAQETLRVHSLDPREHVYSEAELEAGRTHDDLWNAAQMQVVSEVSVSFLRPIG